MKSKIIHPDGHQQAVKPKNKKKFTKSEAKSYISDDLEVVKLDGSILMVIDSKGFEKGLKKNVMASRLTGNNIVGDVLLCNKGEF